MDQPPDLWAKARKSLPESVREWLSKVESSQDPSSLTSEQQIERLIHQTKNKQAELEARRRNLTVKVGSRKLDLRRYFGNIVRWLDKFKGIGDVAVAFDPIDAALPWAAFRLVLQAVVAEQEHADAIVKLLAATSQFLFTGRVLEAVYNRKSMQMGGRLKEEEQIGQQCLDSLHEELLQLYVRIITALEFCYSILCQNKARRKLIAIFKSPEPAEILSELQVQHKQALERGDTCGKICNHQISFKSLALIRELQPYLENIKDQVSRILVRMDKGEWIRTLLAISDIPFQAHHDEIHCRRTPGTCEWILEQPKFVQWCNEESSVTVLYGDPGAGKTFLISKVIDHAINNAGEEDAIAFFYCKRDEENRRRPQDILRSILRQLSSTVTQCEDGKIHPTLQGLTDKLSARGAVLDISTCKDLVVQFLEDYSRTTIILDALDECEKEMRSELMNVFDQLAREGNRLRIFLSSRTDDDIRQHFRSRPIIEIQATDNHCDISTFVHERLSGDPRWGTLSLDLQLEIRTRLHVGSQSMFQWAALQTQQLLRLKLWTESNIRDQLAKAPSGLKESYDLIWTSIELMSDYEKTLAKRALQWLISAFRPLNVRELSRAMLINPNTDEADDFSQLPTEEDILGICGNLLTYDKRLRMWRFCHLSAREYVEAHIDITRSDQYVAMSCLKVLTTDLYNNAELMGLDFEAASRESPNRLELLAKAASFMKGYIVAFVLEHAGEADSDVSTNESLRLQVLLKRFLGSAQSTSRAYRDWLDTDKGESFNKKAGYLKQNRNSPFPAMSAFGLFYLVKDWWEEAAHGIHLRNVTGLLSLAIWNDQRSIWRFLIDKRIGLGCATALPLIAAIEKDRSDVFESLLEAGAPVNGVQVDTTWQSHQYIDTPLKAALYNCRIRHGGYPYAQMLLQNGANADLRTAQGDTVWVVAKFGHKEEALLLLGAGMRQVSSWLLAYAAEEDWPGFIRLAIRHKADLNFRYSRGTPLMSAVRIGSWGSVEALLDLGVSVNAVSSFGPGTALAASVCLFSGWIFHSLLDAGADINLNNGRENPLTWILKAPQLGVEGDIRGRVRKILWAGIDVDQVLVGAICPTALSFATAHNELAVVKLLLDAGADPTLNVEYGFGSALAAAAFHGRLENCGILLDQPGMDVNEAQKGYFDNILFALMDGSRWYLDSRVDHRRRHGWLRSDWSRCHEFMGTLHETEHLKVLDLLFQKGLSIYSPIYTRAHGFPSVSHRELGANELVATRILHRDGLCDSLSLGWAHIMWELETVPGPQLPLCSRLRQLGFPRPLPAAASIVIKLAPVSQGRRSWFAALVIQNTSSKLGRIQIRAKTAGWSDSQTASETGLGKHNVRKSQRLLDCTTLMAVDHVVDGVCGMCALLGESSQVG
ncbi:hypothetical protein NM208_g14114 [Fusarium decemcellulare]|uniref:Uncharacterized protein n=1 Tax=Fusarium decemcellulare TaxID=57161 RepID=A0ACC1RH76_9HYPO|nr:hypothetical protein NM208_g14114 [Fusarium decemcellulare]